MKKAFITGVTGQDGSYLAELLLTKGYEVHGLVRRTSTINRERIEHIHSDPTLAKRFFLHYGDLTESWRLLSILHDVRPDEIYNLGAQSHVRISFDMPEYTTSADATGTLNVLEAMRSACPNAHFYQASSSEMYGLVQEVPQTERTPFYPRSPYACAKLYSHWITVNYRESYGLFACSGILFNHESPRRGENFVTRKITQEIAKIALGQSETLYLGNLDSKRDWGFAGDYVEMMWRMLQHTTPDDYVIATGETYTVRDFLLETARVAGMELESNGKTGSDETFIDRKSGKIRVAIDPKFYRPAEVDLLIGNPKKAEEILGWKPRVKLAELVRMMYDADFVRMRDGMRGYPRYFR